MSRDVSTGQSSALAAANVISAVFVQLDFDTPLRVCSAMQTIQWSGYDWIGLGNLGSLEQIYESADLEAHGVKMTLSGVPPDMISTALNEHYQGRRCQIWLAPFDEFGAIVGLPIRFFFGRIDTMDIEVGETATITLSAESRLVDWSRARVTRFNHETQSQLYPGDLGLQYVQQTADKEIPWGRE